MGVLGKVVGDFGNTHDVSQVVVEIGDGPLIRQLTPGRQADDVVDHRMTDAVGLVNELVGGLDEVFILL